MFSKIFSEIIPRRIFAAQKFPRLKFLPREDRAVTHHRRSMIPFSVFDAQSLTFVQRELEDGDVVELRRSDDVLVGLGFFEPKHARVDLFDITPRSINMLPVISEDFFLARLDNAWILRKRTIQNEHTNSYRVVNGNPDGIPSLYVDIFSSSFARIIATTRGSERLVPAVTEYLRSKGAEEVIIDTPSIQEDSYLSLVSPTIPLSDVYVENGTRHFWVPKNQFSSVMDDRSLLNLGHRRARQLLRDLSKDKKVLCINDRSAGATLNALMTAKKVYFLEEDEVAMTWSKRNLLANHGSSVFRVCETINGGIDFYEGNSAFDIIYMENHPLRLSSSSQWRNYISALFSRKLCSDGTVLFLSQDCAPLGISDLSARPIRPSNAEALDTTLTLPKSASFSEILTLLNEVAGKFDKTVRFLRSFTASIDFPILPSDTSLTFTYVCVIESI